MQLTRFSDLALRALMMLATRPPDDPWTTTVDVATAYGISSGHVAKTIQKLASAGFVETRRGRDGGMRLARPAESIRVGDVLRITESGSGLVECFDPGSNECPVTPACGLVHALRNAEAAFYASLDAVTVADLVTRRSAFAKLLLAR